MLTHVDSKNRPSMVDVGDKAVSRRRAVALAAVVFPDATIRGSGDELRTKKGPVFDTAIIAGVMAVKRTSDLIPFCHPLPIDNCTIEIDWRDDTTVQIQCTVQTTHKTGVEMEALTGASAAALTIYDMCKALSHDIEIREVRLIAKSGGKRDFDATDSV